MLVLTLNDGKHQGKLTRREDFPPAGCALGALQRQPGRVDPYTPKKRTGATTTIR